MKDSTKKILSFALASTIIAGVPTVAHANDNNTSNVVLDTTNNDIYYTVKNGDTLGKISTMFYGSSEYYNELATYNNIEDAYLIYVGQTIRIPRTRPIKSPDCYSQPATVYYYPEYSEDQTYTVQNGDLMICIVDKFYGTKSLNYVDKLATYNNLSDPNLIYVGQVLRIPEENKLKQVLANDYTLQYQMLNWRIEHPNEKYPSKENTLVLKP